MTRAKRLRALTPQRDTCGSGPHECAFSRGKSLLTDAHAQYHSTRRVAVRKRVHAAVARARHINNS
jgi:hypothetical protein